MEEDRPLLEVVRPDAGQKFDPEAVKPLVSQFIHEELDGKEYDHMYASDWAKSLSRKVHDGLKEMELGRYKFAVQVTISEDRGQGNLYAGGCLWDEDTDGRVVASFTADSMHCVVGVFAVHSYEFK